MATITVNGKTHEIDVNILYFLVNQGAHEIQFSDFGAEAEDKADEAVAFVINAVNNPPTHYHVASPASQYSHYMEREQWGLRPIAYTLCTRNYTHVVRVDMPPGGGAPTPSKPLCPKCKELHDAIEGWD
jgi:hypothetical protein